MSDYISREAAIDYIKRQQCKKCSDIGLCGNCAVLVAIRLLETVPAADVEPERNGRWEECDWVDVDEHGFCTRRTFKAGLRCNQCACVFKKKLLWKRNYCPSCGAKMCLEDENNDD